jgi:hypothetical protein
MSRLGGYGRFGNQLFQYAFLKAYADAYGCELQLPPWVGNELFGLTEPPVSVSLPAQVEQNNHLEQAQPPKGAEYVDRDFRGYAQYHTSFYEPFADEMRQWFTPVRSIRERLDPAVAFLQGTADDDRAVIGIHLRRGDYGQLIFPITPVEWYLAWLAEHWDQFHNPVLFIATETPSLVKEFAKYNPVMATDLGVELRGVELAHYPYLAADRQLREPWQLDFYPDFYLLSKCDVLVTPTSTFSMMAALLNPHLAEFWRSDLKTQGFRELDPWSCLPITHEYVDDYMIPGTYLDTNPPYWERRTLKAGGYVKEIKVRDWLFESGEWKAIP